jgi:hypothetical protein
VAQAAAPTGAGYPAPPTASATFVPGPDQANPTEESYPGDQENGTGEAAYPGAGNGLENGQEGAGTPAVLLPENGDTRSLATQPPLDQQNPPETQQPSGRSNTLFLWIGFAAAMLIFGGGVVGSILLFSRRSSQK